MTDNIVFNDIPLDIYEPGTYVGIRAARNNLLPDDPTNVLIIAQRLSSGTLGAGEIRRHSRVSEVADAYGAGSVAHLMFAAALKANPYGDLRVLAMDDVVEGGQAATGSVTLDGTVIKAGTIPLYIAGMPEIIAQTRIPVNVTTDMSAEGAASAMAIAINARNDLPVTANVPDEAPAKVVITAKNIGTVGNGIDIRIGYFDDEGMPAGLNATIVSMTGGSGDPDISDAIAAMGDGQYMAIITPWTGSASMAALEAEMANRWGPLSRKEGTVYTALSATFSAAITWAENRNGINVATLPMQNSPTPPWVIAAALGSVCERERAVDPALQLNTVVLPGVLAPKEQWRPTDPEKSLLLRNGLSTYKVDAQGRVRLSRVVSNYRTDEFGNRDETFLDITTSWAAAYFRYAVVTGIQQFAGRKKLAKRHDIPESVTLGDLSAKLLDIAYRCEDAGIVRDVDLHKDKLVVKESLSVRGRVNSVIPTEIIPNLYVFAAAVELL